ncbi:MAG TPA: hypothetical protein VIM58_01570 [Candidatus Methylacidiphilales bacterium]
MKRGTRLAAVLRRSARGVAVFLPVLASPLLADPVQSIPGFSAVAPVTAAPAMPAKAAPPNVALAPAAPKAKPDAFASSPASGKESDMAKKMFNVDGKGDFSGFLNSRSPFDAQASAFDMKTSAFSDKRVELGGRSIYSPMLDTFDKRIETSENTFFKTGTLSPMSGAVPVTDATKQASAFDARRAVGFDKTVAVPEYKGREADLIQNPKPLSEATTGADPMTVGLMQSGAAHNATISLEEVRDLINKDVKGASLSIPQPK